MDAYKNFDVMKPLWCEGSLQEKGSCDGKIVTYYVNFGSACGCGKSQTSLVKLGMRKETPLAVRQAAAAQKVLNKVSLSYMGAVPLPHELCSSIAPLLFLPPLPSAPLAGSSV